MLCTHPGLAAITLYDPQTCNFLNKKKLLRYYTLIAILKCDTRQYQEVVARYCL